MSDHDSDGDAGRQIRQHVRGVLNQLTARQHKRGDGAKPSRAAGSGDKIIEGEGEQDRSSVIRDREGPA